VQREAGPYAGPHIRDINLKEQPSAVVAEALARNDHASRQRFLIEPEGAEHADGIARQEDACTLAAPACLTLDHVDRESLTGERASARETSDTRADYENAYVSHVHRGPSRVAPMRRSLSAMTIVQPSHTATVSRCTIPPHEPSGASGDHASAICATNRTIITTPVASV